MRFLVALFFALLSFTPVTPVNAQIGPPSIARCVEWLADNPDFTPHFDRLPPICFWHYRGWSCVQDWTPAGWLRPGGYCDAVWSNQSLASHRSDSDEPYMNPCDNPVFTKMEPPPPIYCYPDTPGYPPK